MTATPNLPSGKRGITPREAAVALGLLSAQEYDRLVDLRAMAGLPPA